jgi:hypothetical protein
MYGSAQVKEPQIEYKVYNPTVAGINSILISGLGQMYCGETRRGLHFMGGSLLSIGMILGGAVNEAFSDKTSLFSIFGFAGYAFLKTWSVSDAVSLAKDKNLKNRQRFSLVLIPTITSVKFGEKSTGLGLVVGF